MTARSSARRSASQRRPPGRRVSLGVALLLVLLALVVGGLVGYVAHGDEPTGTLITESREVPMVTVTVTQAR